MKLMVYTDVMANTPKPVRKVAKNAVVGMKSALKLQKNRTLGKPQTPADRKVIKKSAQKLNKAIRGADREDDLTRRGQFDEARNVANKRMSDAGIRLDAYLTPKMDKRADDAYNPGPSSGFLSKAKKTGN